MFSQKNMFSKCSIAAEPDDGITNAGEAKFVGIDFADRNPKGFCSVICSKDGGFQGFRITVNVDEKVHVKGVDAHATVFLDIR